MPDCGHTRFARSAAPVLPGQARLRRQTPSVLFSAVPCFPSCDKALRILPDGTVQPSVLPKAYAAPFRCTAVSGSCRKAGALHAFFPASAAGSLPSPSVVGQGFALHVLFTTCSAAFTHRAAPVPQQRRKIRPQGSAHPCFPLKSRDNHVCYLHISFRRPFRGKQYSPCLQHRCGAYVVRTSRHGIQSILLKI